MNRVGIVGIKRGMTRIFLEDGRSMGVTVIEAKGNRIVQVKTQDADGYHAIQVTMGEKKASRLSKPAAGHFAKANVGAGDGLWEFRLGDVADYTVGDALEVTLFEENQRVDVRGVSKGKGFAGTVKRHNFSTQDMSHGNSLAHRKPGSIGQNQTPGRVFKGKKMAGQMGNVRCTVQSLRVVRVDAERGLLFIQGGVPGAPGGKVVVLPAVKSDERK